MTCNLTGYIVGTTALFVAAAAIGQTEIPNTFQAGQPARAAEVNENFSTLESAVNKNASDLQQIQIGPQGPQGIQGVQGDIGPQGSRSADFNQPYEFAGFSDTDAAGNGGLVALNQACNAKFGPGARIASSWEILETSFNSEDAIAAGIAGQMAWIKESLVFPGIDASGRSGSEVTVSCDVVSGPATGTVVNSEFRYFPQACATLAKVACSKPVAQKVTYAFAGFSIGTAGGFSNLGGQNLVCASEFGAGARASFTLELLNASDLQLQAGTAWVKPTIRGGQDVLGGDFRNCHQSGAGNGIVLNGQMQKRLSNCASSHEVACSVPLP